MKCMITREMHFRPIPQRVTYVQDVSDSVFPELNVEEVWTWVAHFWDDGDPPWKDGSKFVSCQFPKTWAIREKVLMGYEV